jgi:rfaE bifunctional protein nucleotidyltransferase chain/domain
MNLEEALALRAGRKLVFTNGVFDVVHVGHVRYLQQARSLGDLLIVGMNTDASVQRLGKGPNRPIHSLEDRMEVLAALRAVDGVVAFDDDTPERLIGILQPEIHVKGGDYTVESLPEARIVTGYGGEVVIMPLVPGRSSTEAIRRMGLD